METACGTQEMTLQLQPELWERQACEYLRKSIWLATRPNQIFPSHSDWSRTVYVTQDRPIRNFLFEAKERSLVFWVLKRLPNSSSPYNEQSTSTVKENEEWVLDAVTCEARPTHSRHGGLALRSPFKKGLSFHLSTLTIAVVNVGSLQLPASIEATQLSGWSHTLLPGPQSMIEQGSDSQGHISSRASQGTRASPRSPQAPQVMAPLVSQTFYHGTPRAKINGFQFLSLNS